MIEYAATLYTGMLYAGLVIAVIFAAYLVVSTREDRKRGLAASAGQGGADTRDPTPDHASARAQEELLAQQETPRRGAA